MLFIYNSRREYKFVSRFVSLQSKKNFSDYVSNKNVNLFIIDTKDDSMNSNLK